MSLSQKEREYSGRHAIRHPLPNDMWILMTELAGDDAAEWEWRTPSNVYRKDYTCPPWLGFINWDTSWKGNGTCEHDAIVEWQWHFLFRGTSFWINIIQIQTERCSYMYMYRENNEQIDREWMMVLYLHIHSFRHTDVVAKAMGYVERRGVGVARWWRKESRVAKITQDLHSQTWLCRYCLFGANNTSVCTFTASHRHTTAYA